MLRYLINNFENSSRRIKIELYILPILLIVLIYNIFFSDKNTDTFDNNLVELSTFENKKYDKSALELLVQIEEIAKDSNIFIKQSKNLTKQIYIQATSKESQLLYFLNHIEGLNDFTKIDTLNLKKIDANNYSFEIKVDISKFYLKNIETKHKKFQENSKVNNQAIIEAKSYVKPEFTINAIVGDYAL